MNFIVDGDRCETEYEGLVYSCEAGQLPEGSAVTVLYGILNAVQDADGLSREKGKFDVIATIRTQPRAFLARVLPLPLKAAGARGVELLKERIAVYLAE